MSIPRVKSHLGVLSASQAIGKEQYNCVNVRASEYSCKNKCNGPASRSRADQRIV